MQCGTNSRSFGAWVDAFRWLAALSVLITHTGIRMLPPVAAMPVRSWMHIAYAFAAGFDHQAVMVFFVLSGMLVGGSVVREIETTGNFAVGRYVVKRAVRLGIVLWPALVLVALCDTLALGRGAVDYGIFPADVQDSLSLPVFACNMVLLQTAACVQFGGNGALWSLFNEGWYYLLCPVVAMAFLARLHLWLRMAMAIMAATVLAGLTSAQFTGSAIGPYMLVWGVGVGVAVLDRPLIRSPAISALVFAAVLLAVRLFVRRSFAGEYPLLAAQLDLAVAFAFGVLLLSMRFCAALPPPPWARIHAALAGFSFSLYCTHIPILAVYITLLMGGAGLGWQMQGTGAAPWLAVAGALATCVGFAYVFSLATEVHTDTVRRWLWRMGAARLRASR